MGNLRSIIFRKDSFRAFWRIMRSEGPVSTWRRGWAFIRRTKATTGGTWVQGGQPNLEHPFPIIQFWSDMSNGSAFSTSKAPALLTKRRIIAMIGDLNLPQCKKYRIEQLTELWASVGVEYRFSHYQDIPRSLDLMQTATHLMLYRLQRHDQTTMYMYEARRLRMPVLYDIDDPLFSVEAYATYGNMNVLPHELKAHFLSQAPLYLDALNGADVASFSTPGLRDHAMSLSPRPAYVRRNFADAVTLEAGRAAIDLMPAEKPGFTLCFASGSQGHEVDFQTIAPQVGAFLAGADDRKLLVLGHFRTDLLDEGLRSRVETRPYSDYPAYLENLAMADAAIMPLADDLFNRCKSGVRVIDASAAGVASVVGTVGDLPALVDHGKTGFIASTPEDWSTAFETLAADKAATRHMGNAARAVLEQQWSAQDSAHIIDPEMVAWVRD